VRSPTCCADETAVFSHSFSAPKPEGSAHPDMRATVYWMQMQRRLSRSGRGLPMPGPAGRCRPPRSDGRDAAANCRRSRRCSWSPCWSWWRRGRVAAGPSPSSRRRELQRRQRAGRVPDLAGRGRRGAWRSARGLHGLGVHGSLPDPGGCGADVRATVFYRSGGAGERITLSRADRRAGRCRARLSSVQRPPHRVDSIDKVAVRVVRTFAAGDPGANSGVLTPSASASVSLSVSVLVPVSAGHGGAGDEAGARVTDSVRMVIRRRRRRRSDVTTVHHAAAAVAASHRLRDTTADGVISASSSSVDPTRAPVEVISRGGGQPQRRSSRQTRACW